MITTLQKIEIDSTLKAIRGQADIKKEEIAPISQGSHHKKGNGKLSD